MIAYYTKVAILARRGRVAVYVRVSSSDANCKCIISLKFQLNSSQVKNLGFYALRTNLRYSRAIFRFLSIRVIE